MESLRIAANLPSRCLVDRRGRISNLYGRKSAIETELDAAGALEELPRSVSNAFTHWQADCFWELVSIELRIAPQKQWEALTVMQSGFAPF